MNNEKLTKKIESLTAELLKTDSSSPQFTRIVREINAISVKIETEGKASKGDKIAGRSTLSQPRNSFKKA